MKHRAIILLPFIEAKLGTRLSRSEVNKPLKRAPPKLKQATTPNHAHKKQKKQFLLRSKKQKNPFRPETQLSPGLLWQSVPRFLLLMLSQAVGLPNKVNVTIFAFGLG